MVFQRDLRALATALEDEASDGAVTFTELFGKNSGLMENFGISSRPRLCGFSSYQIYEDRDAPAAIKAIDLLQLIANVAILVGAMVAEELMLAALGPIGIVAGVVLAIVALFVGKPKPKRPADEYMDQRGNAFLANLPSPDSTWVDPVAKASS